MVENMSSDQRKPGALHYKPHYKRRMVGGEYGRL